MTATHATAEREASAPAGAVPTANRVPIGHIDGLPALTPRDMILPAYFGRFGGQEVPNFLLPALDELEATYVEAMTDPEFRAELDRPRRTYLGREIPVCECMNLPVEGGTRIVLKRKDPAHRGAHEGNNVLGQTLLAERMSKKRLIAETGAGQHGTATAMVAALMGMECTIYVGAHDVERQQPSVAQMKLMGASIVPVARGNAGLGGAIDAALEKWSTRLEDTFYLLGSATGPHPFPSIVRQFQSMISEELCAQFLSESGRLPDTVIAAVGGGSNAIGAFAHCLKDEGVELIGVKPAGRGLDSGEHEAPICAGRVGFLYGMRSFVMMDDRDDPLPSRSISAGLDYPSVGPEHTIPTKTGRVRYMGIIDDKALDAFKILSRFEGIIPAMESSHAITQALKMARELAASQGSDEDVPLLLVNLSGHGDEDMEQVADKL